MITIISGTNRKGNTTIHFAKAFYELFKANTDQPVHLIDLQDMPDDLFSSAMYKPENQSPYITALQDEMIIPADKLFIVSPEYNGGISGSLKLFLDLVSIREYKATFLGKKAGIAGVSTGRAGNLRGTDQLNDILQHVGMNTYPKRLPISSIGKLMDEGGNITDEATQKVMLDLVKAFLDF